MLSVARLLGQAIRNIHEETSVSSLFVYSSAVLSALSQRNPMMMTADERNCMRRYGRYA